jgi:hypothetical protein
MKSVRVFSAVLGLGLTITSPAMSQDSNYNTNQYGSRSALMGGAVVGGVRDTSAGFYNPGALGFVDNASLISVRERLLCKFK